MRDDGRPRLEKDREIRVPWDLIRERGVTAGILRVYGAIRARVGFEPAQDNFLLTWPMVDTVAKDAGVSRATVIRASGWLEERDYLIIWRRPNRSSTYGVIVHREEFRARAARDGRAEAINDFLARRSELEHESRTGQAKAASENRKPRHEGDTGRKSQACNPPVGNRQEQPAEVTLGSQPCNRPGVTDATSGVAAVRPGSVDQLNCGEVNRGSAGAELPDPTSTPETPNQNGNGHRSPKETSTTRSRPRGFLVWFRFQSPEQQKQAWGDGVIRKELIKAGLTPP